MLKMFGQLTANVSVQKPSRMAGLDYYMHDGPTPFRFELTGVLAGVDAARLDQAWRIASSTIRNEDPYRRRHIHHSDR